MKDRFYLRAVLDGLISALILLLFGDCICSTYVRDLSPSQLILIATFFPVLASACFLLLIMQTKQNMRIILFALVSFLCYVLILGVAFSISLMIKGPTYIFPRRELSNGDGLLILFLGGYYLAFTFIIRLVIFIVLLVRNTVRKP